MPPGRNCRAARSTWEATSNIVEYVNVLVKLKPTSKELKDRRMFGAEAARQPQRLDGNDVDFDLEPMAP
jgi:hypothetical protein